MAGFSWWDSEGPADLETVKTLRFIKRINRSKQSISKRTSERRVATAVTALLCWRSCEQKKPTSVIGTLYSSSQTRKMPIIITKRATFWISFSGLSRKSLLDSKKSYRCLLEKISTVSHRRKSKFHLASHVTSRHIRRVEPMHFGCVELVEQHGSTRSSRRARHVERVV